jgi:antitoxin component YwqK of YwqJK toxin-antitoxin module
MSKKRKTKTLYRYPLSVEDDTAQLDEAKKRMVSFTRYDNLGNVLEELKYNDAEEIEEKYINHYDQKGNLVEELIYISDDDIAEHKSYERDDKGKIIKAFIHYQDGSKDTILYSYNPDGLLIEKKTIDVDGEYESKECAVYEQGKIVKKENFEYEEKVLEENFIYDDAGDLTEHQKWSIQEEDVKYINHFDKSGNLIKTLKYNSLDQLIAKTTYTYNEKGQVVEITEELPFGKTITTVRYDDKGNAIEQLEKSENDALNNHVERIYNENNELIRSKIRINYHGRGIDQHYILKYDYEYFD